MFLVIFILIAGCNKKAAEDNDNKSAFKVGIAVINNHPALLEIEQGIIDELKAQNMNVIIDSQNANNDANSNLNTPKVINTQEQSNVQFVGQVVNNMEPISINSEVADNSGIETL